jgi:hypothetical protein
MADFEDGDVAAYESDARAMGWRPLEEFKGDPEKFVDAKTFVERGQTYLPLLKADNKRLSGDLLRLQTEVSALKEMLEESHSSLEALKEFHEEDVAKRVKAAKADVRVALARASEEGDHAQVAVLTEQLTELQVAEQDATRAAKESKETSADAASGKKGTQVDYTKAAWFTSWQSENSWYGKDIVKTGIANVVAQQMRAAGINLIEREFLDKMVEVTEAEMEKVGLQARRSHPSKVEGSHGGASGSSAGGESFSDLPADAKAACISQARKMVGPNKAFKTDKDWQKYYTEIYFKQEAKTR